MLSGFCKVLAIHLDLYAGASIMIKNVLLDRLNQCALCTLVSGNVFSKGFVLIDAGTGFSTASAKKTKNHK